MSELLFDDRLDEKGEAVEVDEQSRLGFMERQKDMALPVGEVVMQNVERGVRQFVDQRRRGTVAINTGRIALRRPELHRVFPHNGIGSEYYLG